MENYIVSSLRSFVFHSVDVQMTERSYMCCQLRSEGKYSEYFSQFLIFIKIYFSPYQCCFNDPGNALSLLVNANARVEIHWLYKARNTPFRLYKRLLVFHQYVYCMYHVQCFGQRKKYNEVTQTLILNNSRSFRDFTPQEDKTDNSVKIATIFSLIF